MANLIDALNNAGVSISSVQSSTPATSQPTQSTTQTRTSSSSSEDEMQVVDDSVGTDIVDSEAEATAQRQNAYDAAKETLKQAIANADPETMSSADGDALATALSELRALDTSGVTTDGAIEGEAENQQTEAENYIYMNEEEYNAILNQIEGLSQSSTTDINTFYDVAAQYNDAVAAYADYKAGTNTEFVQDEANFVMLTESDQQKMMEALATSMSQSMSNNVNEIYQSDDYKILTGEIPATDEEKQQARANFTARKESISEAGTAFSELGLPLPENCQIAEVVDWGSEAKEGDVAANDCMDRIIQNYLAKNNLEGYLTPGQAYDMIMQLNPDIYEDINSGRAIYSGEQFLLPDPSAIRGMDSVEEQIQNEMLANLAENNEDFQNIVNGENAENADVEYDSKNNTITVKDGDNIYVFDSEGNTVEDKTTTTEDVQSNIETAISRSLPGSEYTLSEDGIQLEESDRSGRLYADCEITQDGETYNARVVYDPVTGKSTFTVLDEESETYQEFLEYDNENSTVTQYNEDGDKLVQKVNEEGEATASYVYGTDGSLKAVTDSDGNEVTLDDVMDGETITSDFQARAVLEYIANGDTVDDAIERVQNNEYSSESSSAPVALTQEEIDEMGDIASRLIDNYPEEGLEFEKVNGVYTAQYSVDTSENWGTVQSTYQVTYDPETGKTSVRAYNTTDGAEMTDENNTSIIEYDPSTNTKTLSCAKNEDGTFSNVVTSVYSDDSLDDSSLLRESSVENGNITNVTTYDNGAKTGSYSASYDDNGDLEKITLKDAFGADVTLTKDELASITTDEGESITSNNVNDIFERIQNGESAQSAFNAVSGGSEIISKANESNVYITDKDTQTESEQTITHIREAMDEYGLEGFDSDAVLNADGTVTYTKPAGTDGEEDITYTASRNDDGTVTLVAEYDGTNETITLDTENGTKRIDKEKDGVTSTEFTKFTYDTNGTAHSDTVQFETNEDGTVENAVINGTTVEFSDLELGDDFSIEDVLTELTTLGENGSTSPNSIFNKYGIDVDGASTSVKDNQNTEAVFDMDDYYEAISNGNAKEYLSQTITQDNVGAVLQQLQEDNEYFELSQLYNNTYGGYYEAGEYLSGVCSAALEHYKDDDSEESKAQYDAMVNIISMDAKNSNGVFAAMLTSENAPSAEIIADITMQYTINNGCETPEEAAQSISTLLNGHNLDVNMPEDGETTPAIELINTFIELSSSQDDYKNGDMSIKYSDIASQMLAASFSTTDAFGIDTIRDYICDSLLDYDDGGMSFIEFSNAYQALADKNTLYKIYKNDAEKCEKIAQEYMQVYNSSDSEWQDYIADTVANDLYGAMVGSANGVEAVEALFSDNMSQEFVLHVERAFNAISATEDGFDKDHNSLYEWMTHQGGDVKERAKELFKNGYLLVDDDTVSE